MSAADPGSPSAKPHASPHGQPPDEASTDDPNFGRVNDRTRSPSASALQTTCSLITRGAAIAGSLSEFKSPTAEQLQVVTTPAVGTSAPALDSVQSSALSSPAGPDTRKRYMMDTPAGGWPAYSEALADSESKRPRQGPGATRLMTDKKMSPVRSMRNMDDDPELQD